MDSPQIVFQENKLSSYNTSCPSLIVVIDNINADYFSYIYHISAIGRGGVVVCGKEGEQHVLRVMREEGERSSVAILDDQPDGMAVVDLRGKLCAAVSYG